MSNLDGGFYAIAATGAAGSQSNYWGEVVSVTKSGSSYLTGKYWPASDPGLTSFYASNVSPTFAASGPTVTLADCNTDVVCAHAASPTYGVNCPLTFNHVLARVGTITLNTKSGYELSSVTATLKNGVTGGTYNLRTGAWSSLGAGSDKSTGAFSGNTSAQNSDNDIWLIPGTYTISLSYTLTKGDYVYNAVNKTGSVTILAGNTNNITTTAVGVDATEIVFSVSLTPWSNREVAWDMSFNGSFNMHAFTLNGRRVLFANTNLQWNSAAPYQWCLAGNNSTFDCYDSPPIYGLFAWATSGYNGNFPNNSSTTDTDYGPAISSGIFGNEYDWGKYNTIYSSTNVALPSVRIPSIEEWRAVLNPSRMTTSSVAYAAVRIQSYYMGLAIFSDDYVHPGDVPALASAPSYTDLSASDWVKMSAAGAVFLPAKGYRQTRNGNLNDGNSFGYYWSSTAYNTNEACMMYFTTAGTATDYHNFRHYLFSVRLIMDE